MLTFVLADPSHLPLLSSNCCYSEGFHTLCGLDTGLLPGKTRKYNTGLEACWEWVSCKLYSWEPSPGSR